MCVFVSVLYHFWFHYFWGLQSFSGYYIISISYGVNSRLFIFWISLKLHFGLFLMLFIIFNWKKILSFSYGSQVEVPRNLLIGNVLYCGFRVSPAGVLSMYYHVRAWHSWQLQTLAFSFSRETLLIRPRAWSRDGREDRFFWPDPLSSWGHGWESASEQTSGHRGARPGADTACSPAWLCTRLSPQPRVPLLWAWGDFPPFLSSLVSWRHLCGIIFGVFMHLTSVLFSVFAPIWSPSWLYSCIVQRPVCYSTRVFQSVCLCHMDAYKDSNTCQIFQSDLQLLVLQTWRTTC